MSANGTAQHFKPDPQHQLKEMALTIFLEASGEKYRGKLAVAWVITNRVADPRWPETPEKVCWDPHQFSCNEIDAKTTEWRNARLQNAIQGQAYTDSWKAACSAFFGFEPDPTKGATHYLVTSIQDQTYWAKGKLPCAVIGHHSFFSTID